VRCWTSHRPVSGLIPLITIGYGSVPLPYCVVVISGRLKTPLRTRRTAVSSLAGEEEGPQITLQSDDDTSSVGAASTAGLELTPAALAPGRKPSDEELAHLLVVASGKRWDTFSLSKQRKSDFSSAHLYSMKGFC
jgi:hypothetical protein